jgi:transposase
MMATIQPKPESESRAKVMRLHYLEGLSMRAIAKRLHLSRKTVRKHLGQVELAPTVQKAQRQSLLDPYHHVADGRTRAEGPGPR